MGLRGLGIWRMMDRVFGSLVIRRGRRLKVWRERRRARRRMMRSVRKMNRRKALH